MTSLLDIAGFEWPSAVSNQDNGSGQRTSGGREQAFALDVSEVLSLGQSVAGDVRRRVGAAAGGVISAARLWKRPANSKHSLPPPLSDSLPWLQEYTAVRGYKQVLDKGSLLQEDSGMFPADHFFKALMLKGMMHNSIVLLKYASSSTPSRPASSTDLLTTGGGDISISVTGAADNSSSSTTASPVPSRSPSPTPALATAISPAAQQCEVVAVYQLGTEVCGHAGIVHGGLTAAMIDESIGYLLYLARSAKVLSFEAVVTASLEVQYKKPLLPSAPVVVTAWVSEQQGRKIWVEAVVSDTPYTRPADQQGTAAPAPTTPTNTVSVAPAASAAASQATAGSSQAAAVATAAAAGEAVAGAAAPRQQQQQQAATVYASAKALFIIPRPGGASAAALQQAAGGQKLFHAPDKA